MSRSSKLSTAAVFSGGFSARIDRMIVRAVNRDPVAGMVVGIVDDTALRYLNALGPADFARDLAATGDTVFRVGSISKTVTGIAVLQMYERGRLDLDDDVTRYLPDIPIRNRHPEPVRVRHLLTHTGGIGELRCLSDLLRPVVGLSVPRGGRSPTLAEYYRGGVTVGTRPGTHWYYSNHGFSLLGHVVGNLSGMSFEAYVAEHVFRPLGMASSSFVLTDDLRPRLAAGYAYTNGRFDAQRYREIAVRPAGSMFSTAVDMAQYMIALLNAGRNAFGAVLQPASVALMLSPHFRLHPRLPAMGFSFFVDDIDGFRSARHDGGWPGFAASMVLAPDRRIGVFALSNTSGLLPLSLVPRLTRRVLGFESAERRLRRAPVRKRPELWTELVGTYHTTHGLNVNLRTWRSYGWRLHVTVKGSDLILRSVIGALRKGERLIPIADDDPLTFAFPSDGSLSVMTFRRGKSGRIEELQWQLNTFQRSRRSVPRHWFHRLRRLVSADSMPPRRRSLT